MTKRLVRRMALMVGLFCLTGSTQAQQGNSRGHGEGQREEWQKVGEIFQAMGIKPGSVVADVGAGDGFFTTRLSAAVGADGRVYAVDVAAGPLRRLRQRVADESLSNVEVVEGATDDPRLPAAAVDAILIVNAYHEMTEHQAMLAKLRAALKPGGRLVIVEPISQTRRDSARDQQTKNHEIAVDFVKQDAKEAGFTQLMLQDPFTSRHNHDTEWLLVLTPAPAPSSGAGAWAASKKDDWRSPDLRIAPTEFKKLMANDEVLILDVRDPASYRQGHLPGAILMTPEELTTQGALEKLRAEKRLIVTYCS